MKVTVTFDTDSLFKESHRPAVNEYLRREIRASEAAQRAGLSREQWEHHMAAIFATGNSEIKEIT